MTGGELALLAAALKGFEVYRKNQKSQQVKRDRYNAQQEANRQSRLQAEEALAAAKRSRDTHDVKDVGDKRFAEEKRLGSLLSAVPREEYAVSNPVRRGEPSIITTARDSAKEKACGDILGYAKDRASLTASTQGLASQDYEGLMSRADISEAARQQQEIQRMLALKLAGIDPRSLEAEMAGQAGDIALMAAFGA